MAALVCMPVLKSAHEPQFMDRDVSQRARYYHATGIQRNAPPQFGGESRLMSRTAQYGLVTGTPDQVWTRPSGEFWVVLFKNSPLRVECWAANAR